MIFAVVIFLSFSENCGIRHMMINISLEDYEQTLDPESCEALVEQIDLFNEGCEPEIEILDCG